MFVSLQLDEVEFCEQIGSRLNWWQSMTTSLLPKGRQGHNALSKLTRHKFSLFLTISFDMQQDMKKD